jgi:hypothetical protein
MSQPPGVETELALKTDAGRLLKWPVRIYVNRATSPAAFLPGGWVINFTGA